MIMNSLSIAVHDVYMQLTYIYNHIYMYMIYLIKLPVKVWLNKVESYLEVSA